MHRSQLPRILSLALISVSLAVSVPSARAAVLRVKWDAYGPGHDGKSWDTAFTTVQPALNAAASGDEVWVARGTYRGTLTLSKPGVGLYGGFAGTETIRGHRRPAIYLTILDAELKGRAITIVTEAAGVVLDGFTILRGTGGGYLDGGGILCYAPDVTISQNVLRANIAVHGGGLYAEAVGLIIRDNLFELNEAFFQEDTPEASGGGLYLRGGTATVRANTFRDNLAHTQDMMGFPQFANTTLAYGGGLFYSGTEIEIRDNEFVGNDCIARPRASRPYAAGSGIFGTGGIATIANNTFAGNGISDFGGGLSDGGAGHEYLVNGGAIVLHQPVAGTVVANNIIAFNETGFAQPGGIPVPFHHNNVFANSGGNFYITPDPTGANGNISADPLFLDGAAANVRLQPGSPVIDAGDTSVTLPGETDRDGGLRVLGPRVDMGAHEFDPLRPHIWYVKPDASGAQRDGRSWETALATVTAAIALAQTGEQVWVAQGLYLESLRLDKPDVGLYGGFAGAETALTQGDPKAHISILDGGGAKGVVVFGQTATRSTVVDGFTIRNGWADHGGGSQCVGGSRPVVRGNVITRNKAIRGGGVMVEYGSDPLIIGNVISDNDAPGGGGLEFWTDAGGTLTSNLFIGNTANFGSHILLSDGGTPLIVNNTFIGGAVDVWWGSKPLVNNVFHNTSVSVPDPGFLRHNGFSGTAPQTYGGQNGNINADPLFVNPQNGDYRLQPASPFVNAGDTTYAVGPTDLAGRPRVVPPAVDMGAYESQTPPPFTIPDVAAALRIAGGLSAANGLTTRYNVAADGGSDGIDLLDATVLARKAAGLDANP